VPDPQRTDREGARLRAWAVTPSPDDTADESDRLKPRSPSPSMRTPTFDRALDVESVLSARRA
jgi:hypothetical protein